MRRFFLSLLAVSTAAVSYAQSNIPLGLPSDQLVPTRLEGYKLVLLDRKKEVIFDIENKRVVVEVPVFIYLPESDKHAEIRDGLRAIHGDLARLASSREPVDPQRLWTIFLALDSLIGKPDPVALPPQDVKSIEPPKGEETTKAPPKPEPELHKLIRTNG